MNRTTSRAATSVVWSARALTNLVYAFVIAALVILLFRGLFEPVQLDGRSVLDVSILFAMIVYGTAALGLHALIDWLTARILAMRWYTRRDGLPGNG